KRACSSTLEATASASRVWPRTMPTPVSSQEVSMPRTSGSSAMGRVSLGSVCGICGGCGRLGGRGYQAHDQGVDVARLVVAAPEADRFEAEALVEALCAEVVHPYLQQHLAALEGGGGREQGGQQAGAEAGAPLVAGGGDGLDVAGAV